MIFALFADSRLYPYQRAMISHQSGCRPMRAAAPDMIKHATPAKIAMLKGRIWNAIEIINKTPIVVSIMEAIFVFLFVNVSLRFVLLNSSRLLPPKSLRRHDYCQER